MVTWTDTYRCLVYIYIMHLCGIACYEWGYNAGVRLKTVLYHDVIILPDPELVAPSDGFIRKLTFYSVDTDKFFKLVVLKPNVNKHQEYYIQQVSNYIHAQYIGTNKHDIQDNFFVDKNDVIAFLIFDKMPIPYEEKIECTNDQTHLLHTFNKSHLSPGDVLDFTGQTDCYAFSYVMEVESPVTTVKKQDNVDGTQSPFGVEGNGDNSFDTDPSDYDNEVNKNGDDKLERSDRCDPDNCDVPLSAGDDDGDLFRYVIFGPLIVLWIIVTAICSIKLKRRLPCCRPGPITAVTPASVNSNQPIRRPRFGRVTLSRAPPPGMIVDQPKPLVDMTPNATLPPYPGLDTDQSIHPYPGSGAFAPSYPPPAYSPTKKQINNDQFIPEDSTAGPDVLTQGSDSRSIPAMTSDSSLSHTGETFHTVADTHHDNTRGTFDNTITYNPAVSYIASTHAETVTVPLPSGPWLGGYNVDIVPMQQSLYQGPPPSYQEATESTETHM